MFFPGISVWKYYLTCIQLREILALSMGKLCTLHKVRNLGGAYPDLHGQAGIHCGRTQDRYTKCEILMFLTLSGNIKLGRVCAYMTERERVGGRCMRSGLRSSRLSKNLVVHTHTLWRQLLGPSLSGFWVCGDCQASCKHKWTATPPPCLGFRC